MNETEFALIEALIARNEDMRVIAVGDDDQNIYEFRGSSSKYIKSFITDNGAEKYELLENYRSKHNIVEFANAFSTTISQRLSIISFLISFYSSAHTGEKHICNG